MYDLMGCPSWEIDKAVNHYEGKKYNCEVCWCTLENHEVFLKEGKPYCGCCK